ncbi:hypothetical protein G7Z17_g2641 [Cylindrodendrum hubeiense]|uniref:PD-(D/E)XK nuclease-like domain-containing protein n=1 Tax=Cylindrodendrum hubeiense TaxID=595255 RepID=A0A9P5LKT7_9HYPO|nr:hypothetical protein G7Z17_g2641 [Cylindrodendrum hubeiense]
MATKLSHIPHDSSSLSYSDALEPYPPRFSVIQAWIQSVDFNSRDVEPIQTPRKFPALKSPNSSALKRKRNESPRRVALGVLSPNMSRDEPRTPSPRKSARLNQRELGQDLDDGGRQATTLQTSPDQTPRPRLRLKRTATVPTMGTKNPAAEPSQAAPPPPSSPTKLKQHTLLPAQDPYTQTLQSQPFDRPASSPGKDSTSTRSTRSTTSTRSRSPVKRMADLQLSAKPIMHLSLSSMPNGLPPTVRPLYKSLRRIATGVGVIPDCIKKAARSRVSKQDNRPLRHNYYTPTPNSDDKTSGGSRRPTTKATCRRELELVTEVCSTARLWLSENVNEASWNAFVHSPLLKLALYPLKEFDDDNDENDDDDADDDYDYDDDNDEEDNEAEGDAQDADSFSVYSPVTFWDITTARPHPDCVPRHIRGDTLEAKMVDFCITVSDAHIQDAALRTFNAASLPDAMIPGAKPIGSINHTEYSPLTRRPISVSIESKAPSGSPDKALAQLSIWAASHFERLRRLRDVKRRQQGDAATEACIPMALPLLLAIGSSWRLYFAVDTDRDIVIVDTIKLGDTDQLVGCYQVVAALRELARWTETTFRSWLLDNVLLDGM